MVSTAPWHNAKGVVPGFRGRTIVRNWPEKLTITIKRLVALVVACVTAVGALSLVAP